MVQVDPETYECPNHRVDLTDQVVEQLEELGPPVAYPFGRRTRQRDFEVVVTCPGDGGHPVPCEGRFTP